MHTGVRWAVFWQRVDGADIKVMARFVDNTGKALGSDRVTVLKRNAAILDPHVVFDSRKGRFLLAFASETAGERGIVVQIVNADGATVGPAIKATALPPTASSRRPRLALNPSGGFTLLWEDNSQGTFDVYFSLLDANGSPTPVTRLRVSDTPNDTSGFAAAADRFGVRPVWQSSDEINSDVIGVYAVGITSDGVFRAQVDPATPLLAQQFYVRQTLIEHGDPQLTAVAQAWGGGDHYLLRDVGDGLSDELYLVRTNADGLPDSALAADGAVKIANWVSLRGAGAGVDRHPAACGEQLRFRHQGLSPRRNRTPRHDVRRPRHAVAVRDLDRHHRSSNRDQRLRRGAPRVRRLRPVRRRGSSYDPADGARPHRRGGARAARSRRRRGHGEARLVPSRLDRCAGSPDCGLAYSVGREPGRARSTGSASTARRRPIHRPAPFR